MHTYTHGKAPRHEDIKPTPPTPPPGSWISPATCWFSCWVNACTCCCSTALSCCWCPRCSFSVFSSASSSASRASSLSTVTLAPPPACRSSHTPQTTSPAGLGRCKIRPTPGCPAAAETGRYCTGCWATADRRESGEKSHKAATQSQCRLRQVYTRIQSISVYLCMLSGGT